MYFGEIEIEIKQIIQASISKRIHEEDVKNLPLGKFSLLDIFYTNIMALGLNYNLETAVEDLYETKSPIEEAFYGKIISTKEFLRNSLQTTENECKNEIAAYKMAVALKKQNATNQEIVTLIKQLLQ